MSTSETPEIAASPSEDTMIVSAMPMDTATFKRHPMKGQIQTPFNWDEFVFTMKEFVAALIAMLPLLVALKCVAAVILTGWFSTKL